MKLQTLLFLLTLCSLFIFAACNDEMLEPTGGEEPPQVLGYIDVLVEWCDAVATPACENDDYMPLAGVEIILFNDETDLNEGEPIVNTAITNSEGKTTFSTTESQIFYIKANGNLGNDSQAVSVSPNQRAQVYFYFEGE